MTAMGKTLTLASAALVFALGMLLPASAQDGVVITISRIAGTVEASQADATGGAWTTVKAGQQLSAGWTLRTGEDGKVQLTFPRDNVVILKGNSVLYVENLEPGGGASVASDGGDFLVNLKNALSPGSEFEVKTPSALAVVRGTEFGVSVRGEEESVFFGYENTVEIINEHGTSLLTEGTTVTAAPDSAPGEPEASGSEADDFLADVEDESAFEEWESSVTDWEERLAAELQDATELSGQFSLLTAEWRRYFDHDETAKSISLYAQILSYMENVDRRSGQFLDLLREPGLAELVPEGLSIPSGSGNNLGAAGFNDLAGTLPQSFGLAAANLGTLAGQTAQEYASAYGEFEDIASDAEPLIDGHEDVLDQLHGLLYEDDPSPSLGLRWNLADSDSDGLSDIDETLLGTDPFSDESQDGFITLISPDDGEQYDYPSEDQVEFAFAALESDYVLGYNLILEADGYNFLQANVDEQESLPLALLAGPDGAFLNAADAEGQIEVAWHLAAEVDDAALAGQLGTGGPGGASFSELLVSEVRTFTIQLPLVDQGIVVDLLPVGSTNLAREDTLRIDAEISEVVGLGQFEIEISYDPSLLEFADGRKLGNLAGSTLFFSDSNAGLLRITGVAEPGQSAAGIEGVIFELEFTARETGIGFVAVSNLDLRDTLDRELEADGGEEVEYTILAPQSNVNSNLEDNPDDDDGFGKPNRR